MILIAEWLIMILKKRIEEKYWFLHLIVEYEMMRFFEKKRIIIDSRKKQFD